MNDDATTSRYNTHLIRQRKSRRALMSSSQQNLLSVTHTTLRIPYPKPSGPRMVLSALIILLAWN